MASENEKFKKRLRQLFFEAWLLSRIDGMTADHARMDYVFGFIQQAADISDKELEEIDNG